MQIYSLLIFSLVSCVTIQLQPKLTIDEFFNSTYFPSLSVSPTGQHIFVHTRRPAWKSNSFENTLWIYENRQGNARTLITKQLSEIIRPKWSPSGRFLVFMIDETKNMSGQGSTVQYQIQVYDVQLNKLLTIEIGDQRPSAITWSKQDSSLYFTTSVKKSTSEDMIWKDVIRYRQSVSNARTNIHRVNISRRKRRVYVEITRIRSVNFTVSELVYSFSEKKLIFSTIAGMIENTNSVEIYSMDIEKVSSLTKLIQNEAIEFNLQLSTNGRHVFFQVYPVTTKNEKSTQMQQGLYSVDLVHGHVERWGNGFEGNVMSYAIRSQGGIYMLGQMGINVQIYVQETSSKPPILQPGWNGTYQSISASSHRYSSIVFSHSCFERPEEIYVVPNIDQLTSAKAITNENQLLRNRMLPQATSYKWINRDDNRTIEGILHYPPGRYQSKMLPLLVLIHGGPADASLNLFHANWLTWAPLAATEGWLVLEPNYRGSTGYGDMFVDEVRSQILSRPGKDILDGVDQLIADGIVDPTRLTIGGFSYGGFLTNWLITQTTRFNAALSGAGAIEHVSSWGLMDFPIYMQDLIGGYPWDIPQRYLNESAIYQLNKVRTPTHIVTGANDIRVPVAQSNILERGLNYLGIPVELLIFPNEGHSLRNNPWHGKIKVREEIEWLKKYGHARFVG
jgi:dipeptidyl aminopeptidase/acylaminoacyl peptidase